MRRPSAGQASGYEKIRWRVFLRGPALSPFDYGNDFVSLLNVKALVRLDDLPCLLIHPIDGDMKVIVVSIEVQAVHCLMPLKSHAFQKYIDNFFYLFPRRLFSLLP